MRVRLYRESLLSHDSPREFTVAHVNASTAGCDWTCLSALTVPGYCFEQKLTLQERTMERVSKYCGSSVLVEGLFHLRLETPEDLNVLEQIPEVHVYLRSWSSKPGSRALVYCAFLPVNCWEQSKSVRFQSDLKLKNLYLDPKSRQADKTCDVLHGCPAASPIDSWRRFDL